ncbi:MAG: hypothetical protein KF795_00565 [Labilithrix sp.]|nr:hypothetical protein [Labilithrix sp.]
MIAAKDRRAVYCLDRAAGHYVIVEIIAWRDDGAAMVVGRGGNLVPATEHSQYVGHIFSFPGGGRLAEHEAWFRRQLGLASDAPLYRRPTHHTVGFGVSRPTIPAEPAGGPPVEEVAAIPPDPAGSD